MTASIEWIASRYADVSGEAVPGGFQNDGSENSVACIIVTNQFTSNGVVIEGRPDNLLEIARQILRTAELLVEKTMREPELRRLYGLESEVG